VLLFIGIVIAALLAFALNGFRPILRHQQITPAYVSTLYGHSERAIEIDLEQHGIDDENARSFAEVISMKAALPKDATLLANMMVSTPPSYHYSNGAVGSASPWCKVGEPCAILYQSGGYELVFYNVGQRVPRCPFLIRLDEMNGPVVINKKTTSVGSKGACTRSGTAALVVQPGVTLTLRPGDGDKVVARWQ